MSPTARHNDRFKKVVLTLASAITLIGLTGCNPLEPFMEQIREEVEASRPIVYIEPTPTPIPALELNDSISTSITYNNNYHFEVYTQLLTDSNIIEGTIDDFDFDGASFIYLKNGIITYRNDETSIGIEFSIPEDKGDVSYFHLLNNSIYLSQQQSGSTYISKYTINDDGSLWGNYGYSIDCISNNEYSEYISPNGTYYIVSGQTLREYTFEEGFFDRDAEPQYSQDIDGANGLTLIDNNLYVITGEDTDIEVINAVELLNGESTPSPVAYNDISSLYGEGISEYINLLGTATYAGSNGIHAINYTMPIDYTTTPATQKLDVNSDTVYLLAFNKIYSLAEGEADVPTVGTYMNGSFSAVWHPEAIYEDEDGVFATFTITDIIVYSTEVLDTFCEANAISYSEEEGDRTIRTIITNNGTIYAIQGTGADESWILYRDTTGFLSGVGGDNLWTTNTTVTLRLADNVEYKIVTADSDNENPTPGSYRDSGSYEYIEDEDLLNTLMSQDNDNVVISIRRNVINTITFIYNE